MLALHHFNVPSSNQKESIFSSSTPLLLDFNNMPLSIIIQRIERNQCVCVCTNFSSYTFPKTPNRYFVAENQYLFIHYVGMAHRRKEDMMGVLMGK